MQLKPCFSQPGVISDSAGYEKYFSFRLCDCPLKMGLVDLNTSCLSWQGLHFKADWIPTKPTAGLKNPTTEWLVVMSWLFSILLLRSLINAMSCKSISSYSGVSNTRCIIGLINRTQLFPEPLYQVVELQEMQKSISQRFTHLSAVRCKISALESHCLVPLQLFWDTTASLLFASEGRYLQLRKANTKSVSSLADFFVCKFGWRVCIACWNSPEVQL